MGQMCSIRTSVLLIILVVLCESGNSLVSKKPYHRRHGTTKTRNKPFTVFIEGNTGCGKSTFLNHFKKYDNVQLCPEPVEKWQNIGGLNLLNASFKDSQQWSFPFQTYVTLTRLQIHTQRTDKPIKMMERSLYSARYCFTECYLEKKLIHKGMYDILQEWYNYIDKSSDIQADLIVYLRTSPEVAYQRVMSRGRSEENTVSLDFLTRIHSLHEDWLIRGRKYRPAPVLVLDANLGVDKIIDEYLRAERYILHRSSINV